MNLSKFRRLYRGQQQRSLSSVSSVTENINNLNLGASGEAGNLDIFPSTAAKGKLTLAAADNAGDTQTRIINAEQAAARVLTIPDGGASTANFLLSEGAQTIVGAQTLSAILDVAAAGVTLPSVARTATSDGLTTGTIADAGMFQFVAVTSASANNIIVLPTPTPGTIVALYVGANGYELRSSSPTTVAINGGTGAAAESAIAANQLAVLICTSALTWHGFEITAATLTAIEAAA